MEYKGGIDMSTDEESTSGEEDDEDGNAFVLREERIAAPEERNVRRCLSGSPGQGTSSEVEELEGYSAALLDAMFGGSDEEEGYD